MTPQDEWWLRRLEVAAWVGVAVLFLVAVVLCAEQLR